MLTNKNWFLLRHLKRHFYQSFKVSVVNSLLVNFSKMWFDRCCYNLWWSISKFLWHCFFEETGLFVETKSIVDLCNFVIKFLFRLMILTWKNLCFTEKIHWNTRLAASDVFHIFTQLSSFNSIIVQMSEKRD